MKTIDLVYTGALLNKGQVLYTYAILDNGKLKDKVLGFAQALSKHKVGSICTFETMKNNVIRSDRPAVLQGVWPDEEQVTEWLASHESALAFRKSRKANPPENIKQRLAPIAKAYEEADENQRAHLLAIVVKCIVGQS